MNAVISGLWSTQYPMCTTNQNCTRTSAMSASEERVPEEPAQEASHDALKG